MQQDSSNPSLFVQFFVFLSVFLLAVLTAVKRFASKYFSVDGGGFETAADMSIAGAGGVPGAAGVGGEKKEEEEEKEEICVGCGHFGDKKCSGCKRVRYCSESCQSKHWQSDHRFKCKQMRLLQNGEISASRKITNKVLYPYEEFLKLFSYEYNDFTPCGLLNCGNSCFANVVLQCLTSTRPLVAYLLGKNHTRGCVRNLEDWCFLCELQKHVQRAFENSDPFSPINILSRLPKIGGNLGFGQQEDAHEFMRFAIDNMQSACFDEFGGEKFVDLPSQETTLVQHIFGGRLQSQVICTKCETVSNRYENMMDLTVEIQGEAESLEECLDQFTAGEWLDGDNKYQCDGCKDYVKAWKRLTVHQSPNILTITLKRFQSGRFGKLNKRITSPVRLDLGPYMSEDIAGRNGEDLYDLYAVVVHLDMLNASFFGHYICYTKDRLGRWYRIDDCKVAVVEEEEVLAQGAYMLLYTRVTPRPGPLTTPKDPPNKHLSLPKMDISSSFPNGETHQITDVRTFITELDMTNEGQNGNDDFAPASPLREDTVSLSPRNQNPNPDSCAKSRETETGISNPGLKPSKELFTRGFLDRPYRKPLNKERRAVMNGIARNPNSNPNSSPNGLCNGHFSRGEASTSSNGCTNMNGESVIKDVGTGTSNGTSTSEGFEMESPVGRKKGLSLNVNGEFGESSMISNGEVSSCIIEGNGVSSLDSNGEVLCADNEPFLSDDTSKQDGLRQRLVHSKPEMNEGNGVC